MVVLDSNIIIDHLRVYPAKSKLREIEEKVPVSSLAVSVISIQELYAGKSTLEIDKREILIEVINRLKVFPYTFEVGKLAGEITRDLARPLGFPDAAIAATTILNKAKLFTLNRKDFKGIKGLKLV